METKTQPKSSPPDTTAAPTAQERLEKFLNELRQNTAVGAASTVLDGSSVFGPLSAAVGTVARNSASAIEAARIQEASLGLPLKGSDIKDILEKNKGPK